MSHVVSPFVEKLDQYPGKFIVFEGTDGSGKGTCIDSVFQYLKNKGVDVVKTLEPNKEFGIRKMIKDVYIAKGSQSSNRTDLLLFSLDRSLHLDRGIIPWLKEGKIVLCDRYFPSTVAYQGYLQTERLTTRDFSNAVMMLQKSLFPDPDYIFVLDVDPREGLERIQDRDVFDKFEQLDLQEKLTHAYGDMAGKFGFNYFENISLINANKSPEEVQQEVIKVLEDKLGL